MDGWVTAGMYVAVIGALLVILGLTSRATADPIEIQVVPLHNSTAETGSSDDCPSEPSWHFVLAPNNGTFRFVRIVLDLDGTIVTFDEDELIRNGGQQDNVFVVVPDGYSLTDLRRRGSFAEVTPDGDVRFVLSHVCSGHTTTTTTTPTTTPTTTSVPGTTTTTSTTPGSTTTTSTTPDTTTTTSTTTPDTTTTTSTTTPDTTTSTSTTTPTTTSTSTTSTTSTSTTSTSTTTVADSTTTTVEQLAPPTTTSTTTVPATTTTPPGATTTTDPGPTTTVTNATTTTVPRTLVVTGSGSSRPLIMLGVVLILLGTSLVLGSYTRQVGDEVTRN